MLKESNPMEYSNYILDGERYFICDGVVYTNDEDGNRVKVDMLPSSLQMYGECTDPAIFELLITGIKPIENNQALIMAEDGSGLCFGFVERNYSKNKDKYKEGQKGLYQIVALLESVEVPENCEDGVYLEGDDAKRFFDWVEDEVEEDASAVVGFDDVGVYHPCDDFEQTGRYSFYGIITSPCCLSISDEIDAPDPEKTSGFTIPLMNQYNRKNPRFIEASFESPQYYEGEVEEGWGVKAILQLIGLHGISHNVYKYGENLTISPEEKGLFGHDEDEYYEDEDGSRWLIEDDEDVWEIEEEE